MWFLNRVQGAEEGFQQFVKLQFEMAWNASRAVLDIARAGEVKAGVSHPDFGKKWDELTPLVQDFIFRLCVLRVLFFREMAQKGMLTAFLDAGRGERFIPTEHYAKCLHEDWVRLRAVLYSFRTPEERQRLIDAGIKPFGEHEGDIDWAEETPAQKENDLRLVRKLVWVLAYCADSPEDTLGAFVESLFA